MKHRLLRVDDASLVPFALEKALGLVARRGVSEQYELAAGTVRLWRGVDDIVRIWIEAQAGGKVPVISLIGVSTAFFTLPSGVTLPSGFVLSTDFKDFAFSAFGPAGYPPSEYWDPAIYTGFAYAKILNTDTSDEHIVGLDTSDISFHAGVIAARWVKQPNPGLQVSVLPPISDIGLSGYNPGLYSPIATWIDADGKVHAARAATYDETSGSGQKATAIEHFQNSSGNTWSAATEAVKGFGPLLFGFPSAGPGFGVCGASHGGAIFAWSVPYYDITNAQINAELDVYSSKTGRGGVTFGRLVGIQSPTVSDDAAKWVIFGSASAPDGSGLYRDGVDAVLFTPTGAAGIYSGSGVFGEFGPCILNVAPKGRFVSNGGQYVFPLSVTARGSGAFRLRQGYVIGGTYTELDNVSTSGLPFTYSTIDRWAAMADDGRLAVVALPKPVGANMRRRYLLFFDGALVRTIEYTTSNVTETSLQDARLTFVSTSTAAGIETRVYQLEQIDSGVVNWYGHRISVVGGAVSQTTFPRKQTLAASYVFGQRLGFPARRQAAVEAWDDALTMIPSVGFNVLSTDTSL